MPQLENRAKSNTKQLLFTIIKITVTALLVILIFRQADWKKVLYSLRHADLFLISIVLVCLFANVSISTLKWRILLKVHKITYSFKELQRYYFIAVFFNNFLPTNIGGDAFRIYKTLDNNRSKTGAILAVFVERLTGILALLILGLAMFIYLEGKNFAGPFETRTIIILIGIFILCGVVLIALYYLARKTLIKTGRLPWRLMLLVDHIRHYLNNPEKVVYIIVISFAFHLFTVFWMTLLIRALGPSFPPTFLIIVLAVSNLAAMLPISINGIGLMDGSFIYVASRLGMGYDQALMVMLFNRVLLILLSLVGAAYYIKDKSAITNMVPSLQKIRPKH